MLKLFGYSFAFFGFFNWATSFNAIYAFIGASIGHSKSISHNMRNKVIVICLSLFIISWGITVFGTYLASKNAGEVIENFYSNFSLPIFMMTVASIVIFKVTYRNAKISMVLCHISKYSLPIFGIHMFIVELPLTYSLRNYNYPIIDITMTFLGVFICSYIFAMIVGYLDKYKILV